MGKGATKPEDLNSIPESPMVEELTHKLSCALLMGTSTHLLTHIHTIKVKTKRAKSGRMRPVDPSQNST